MEAVVASGGIVTNQGYKKGVVPKLTKVVSAYIFENIVF